MVTIKGLVKRLFGHEAAQALDKEQTDEEQSGDARIGQLKREFAQHPSKGLTPDRLYQIIEAAEQGDLKSQSELFEDMEEKDAQIGADLAKRRQLAAELEWQIVPPDGANRQEKKAAEQAAEVFSGLEVEDLIIDLGSGLGHGWANLELSWARDGALRMVEQPILRPHSWFRLHPEDQNRITLRDQSANGADLWPLGWAQHRHRAKPGYIARSGLLRMLVWPYLFQNYALGDLAELLEIYGLPVRIGKYQTTATDKDKATLLRAVTAIGHRAAGIIPQGMEIDFKEAADGKGDLFKVMIDWCERAKAKVILGGTLTSGTGEGTNTNALGNVHERGQTSLIRSDVRQYAGTIGRDILWPMAAMNFGIEDRRRAPRFFLDTGEGEDYQRLADSLPVFADLGADIPKWWFHEKSKIPRATEQEIADGDILRPRAVPAQLTPLKAITALKGSSPDPVDPSDFMATELAANAQPAVAGWLKIIESMLDEMAGTGATLTDAREAILAAFDELPADQFAQATAAGMEAAAAAAFYDVEQESE